MEVASIVVWFHSEGDVAPGRDCSGSSRPAERAQQLEASINRRAHSPKFKFGVLCLLGLNGKIFQYCVIGRVTMYLNREM